MTIGGARPRPAGPALQDPPLPQTRGAGRTIWEDRNMKKRLISWLLILALCVSVLPAASLAAEPETVTEPTAETTAEPTETEQTEAKQTITPAEPLRAVSANGTEHTHFLCGETDACNKEGHDEGDNKVTFTAWPGISNVVDGGAYYLTTNLNGFTVKSGVNLTLCLNGFSIISGSEGSTITVKPGATFTLCNCKGGDCYIGHSSNVYGAGVFVGQKDDSKDGDGRNDAKFYMYGGTISGNSDTETGYDYTFGSGVVVMGGTFYMYGGKITGNRVDASDYSHSYGGGVSVYNNGTFNMSGGEITGNMAKNGGGGVSVGMGIGIEHSQNKTGGTFTMSGGSIYNNAANYKAGGVYVGCGSETIFTVSGTARITDNYLGSLYTRGADNNVYLSQGSDKFTEVIEDAIIRVGTLDSTAKIGVTTEKGEQVVATGVSPSARKSFTSDSKKYTLNYSGADRTLTMVVKATTTHENHPVCGASCTHEGTHAAITEWKPISDLSKITGDGYYYLTDDVELSASWTCWNDVKLCLNGHSIIENADKNAISLTSSATLTLCDCVGSGAIMHGTDATDGETFTGAGVSVPSTQTFNMYGGTITGNKNTFGGGVLLGPGSTFNMHGGSITKNEAYSTGGTSYGQGGGVYAQGISGSYAYFNMYGGTIEDNTATNRGGGVYVDDYARFRMYGGSITGNTAAQGGGVYYSESGLTVSGNVQIKDNHDASGSANNVYVVKSSNTDRCRHFYIGQGGLGENAEIGITFEGTIATGERIIFALWAERGYYDGNFTYDNNNNGDYSFKKELDPDEYHTRGTHVVSLYKGLHEHPICGTKDCEEHTDNLSWTGVDDLSKITAGTAEAPNYYFLTKDITTSGGWTAPDNVALCLNGHSIVSTTSGTTAITVNGTFTLTDCNGSNGVKYFKESTNGRWVSATKDDVDAITVNGGVIFHTSSGSTDKGMSLRSGKFYMYGGTICGNSGGVYVESAAAMTVSGNATITGNAGDLNYNVYLNGVITVGGKLSETAKIGVTTDETNISAGNYKTVAQSADGSALTEDDLKYFESDKGYTTQIRDGKVVFVNGTLHEHPLCGKTCAHAGDEKHTDDLLWTPLTSENGKLYYGGSPARIETAYKSTDYYYLRAGNYYLAKDITTDLPILISGNVNLCLNGNTLSTTLDQGSDDLTLIAVYQGKTLNLCDCDAKGKGTLKTENNLTFGVEIWHPFSSGYTGGTFNMYGGTITGVQRGVRPYTEKNGGKCTFKMYGGKITGTKRGVYVNDGSIFEMYGGEITNNDTKPTSTEDKEYFGGGVVVDIGATFTMKGGTISNNNAYSGGGVCLLGESGSATTTFNMEGGTITGNTTSDGGGGGVYLGTNTAFNMSGDASVSGNTAGGNCGGGVHVNTGSSFTMSGSSTISGNTAKLFGGGVYVAGDMFTMSENAAISGNNAGNGEKNGEGGGVCVNTGTFTMTGGSITGNNVYLGSEAHDGEGGGGVYVATNATMNVSGNVQITGNWKNGTKNGDVYEKGETGSDNNLYLYAYNSGTPKVLKTVAINGALDGAKIGVTTRYTPTASNPIKIATGATENLDYYTNIFTPDVTGQGYTITQTGSELFLGAHTHSWQYAAGADTIAVSCNADGCNLNGQTFYYVLSASDSTYDGKGKPASVTPPTTTGVTLPETPTISYTQTKPILQQLETRAVPTNAGTYMASITMGDKTASVTYEIKKATPQASDFLFSGPEDLAYDGNAKIAWVTSNTIGGIIVTTKYYKDGVKIDGKPIDVGTYTVKIDVEVQSNNNYQSVTDLTDPNWKFTIQKGTYDGTTTPKTVNIVKGRSAAQSGSLTVADFFPAETQLPAGAKIASVTGSGTMMESVTVNDGTLAYTSNTNITATADESYTVTISTTNYNNFTATLTFHPVDKQPQTGFAFKDVVGGKVAKVYGNTDFKFEATGQVNGSNVTGYDSSNENVATVANDGTVTIKGAGTTTIKATASATDDYAKGVATYELTVSPKTLTAADLEFTQSSTFTKVYDGGTTCTTATVQIRSAAKVNANDELPEVQGTYAYNSKDVNSASKVTFITSERTENTNYTLPANLTVENAASITKRVLTVGNVTTTSKKYDRTAYAYDCIENVELIGVVEGDTFIFDTTEVDGNYSVYQPMFQDANAGENKKINGKVVLFGGTVTANYTFKVGGEETDEVPFEATATIAPADSWALTPVTDLTIRYNNRDPQTYTPNWSTLLPYGQKWTYNLDDTTFTGNAALADHSIGADTGALSYQLSAGDVDDTVTWTITASCSNYKTFELTVTLTLIARNEQTGFKFENNTTSVSKTYGDEDFTIKATGAATGSSVTYTSNDENVAKVNAQTGEVTIVGAGGAVITATAAETDVYASASASYTLTVSKLRIAVPTEGTNQLQYNGEEQTYTPDGLNTTYCSITDNTAKDVNSYTAAVSLIDKANTEWELATENDTSNQTYDFWITPARAIVTALDKKITTGQPAPDLTSAKLGEDYTITGLYGSDSLGSIVLYYADPSNTATEVTPDTSKAGTYAIVARRGGGTSSLNYDPTFVSGTLTIEAVQTSQKLGISAPGRTPGGSYELTPKNAQPGDTVTIAVSPDKGYELGGLTVRDVDGNELDLKRERSGDYTFTMPKSSVSVSISFVREDDALFDDVFAGDYYYNAVQWAAEQGITGGVSKNLFAPDAACTRAQIVTFLWRAAGSPEPETMSAFADVPATAYYAKAVAWAVENGITKGLSADAFGPDAPCTRAQAVTFLARALDESADGAADFTDVSADAYYAKPVAWAVEANVTNGVSKTQFAPNETCTRAQIVTFLYRAYKRMK